MKAFPKEQFLDKLQLTTECTAFPHLQQHPALLLHKLSFNLPHLKRLWTVSFHHQHAFDVLSTTKFLPENTKKASVWPHRICTNSWKQSFSVISKYQSKLMRAKSDKVSHCIEKKWYIQTKPFSSSSTLMNNAPQRKRILTLKKTRSVCKASRFVIWPSMTL